MHGTDEVRALEALVKKSSSVVFFGGAGVSTESGIPDFRSAGGVFSDPGWEDPQEMLSHRYFCENTEDFFRFYRKNMLYLSALPNAAHRRLAEWEAAGKVKAVVTQNIDGLHQAAGSKTVFELHGSVHRNYCMECHADYDAVFIRDSSGVPRCTACGGIVKPDVVLYGEALDQAVVEGAIRAISRADLLIVAGTSLAVYPAAGLVRYYGGNRLVLINRSPVQSSICPDLAISASVGEVLSAVCL